MSTTIFEASKELLDVFEKYNQLEIGERGLVQALDEFKKKVKEIGNE